MKHFLLLACVLSFAAHAEVTMQTLSLPMRDGVKLATDTYRDDSVNQAPVLLTRTPYDQIGRAHV